MSIDAQQAFLRQVGYTLRGVVRDCRFAIRRGPAWFIDVAAQPIAARPAGQEQAELEIELGVDDAAAIASGLDMPTLDSWIESGRIQARGSAEVVARLRTRLRGGSQGGQYSEIDDWIKDPRFVFMNHGFAALDGSDDFAWVLPGDEPWRYSLNLVRQTTRGAALDGARILDVGCGRGGACSYYVRYHAPAAVVGVDLIAEHVAFCTATHQAKNLRFAPGDAQDLPFDDASFDVVTNVESSHCYPRLDRFFSEVRRVLRPGGVFCYTDNLSAGAVEERTSQLREYGEVRRAQTITAEVVQALDLGRSSFLTLMRDMTRGDASNARFIEQFSDSLLRCRAHYTGGEWDYAIWQVAKA